MCPFWEEQEEKELSDACARIAQMFLEYHWKIGYHWRWKKHLLHDPIDPEGLRFMRLYTIYEDVEKCLEPRWKRAVSKWPSMDASIFEDFLKTQVRIGRWEANRQAAIQDFASNPTRYPQNPADCEQMFQLDNDALAALLGERDPVPGWVDSQRRMLEEKAREEQAFVKATPEELAALVEELETVDSVYDPVVKSIGRQGMPALPLLIEKLCSDRGLTSLSSAWAIAAMNDSSSLLPLLEAWAETQSKGLHCEEPSAIHMVMDYYKPVFRQAVADRIDPDIHALLDLKVCDAGAEGLSREVDSDGRPFKRYVVTNGVANTQEVGCGGVQIELRPVEWERRKAEFKTDDVYVARLWVEILDLDAAQDSTPMPEFFEQYGSRPLAVAHVVAFEGNSGSSELWVKTRDGWVRVRRLSGLLT
jgi:hypothetical protein